MRHPTDEPRAGVWQELGTSTQLDQLARWAHRRRWGLALLLAGWLHLIAFSLCHYLSSVGYHEPAGYLAIWLAELAGLALIVRLCGGKTPAEAPPPLARFVVRVWGAYFLLAFNLCTMNGLRGHALFELFPAMASLASFAFLVLTFTISRRFFAAVLVMFTAGLLMAAYLLHSHLVFALAWWLVLQGIGLHLLRSPPAQRSDRHDQDNRYRCSRRRDTPLQPF
jgi:hypothetical protein